MDGKADEITEGSIAVDVLGRRPDEVSDDPGVRNRMYELRQRLDRLYASELPDAPIRIEIPKGGYVPLFVRVGSASDHPETGGTPSPVTGMATQPSGWFPPAVLTVARYVVGLVLLLALIGAGVHWFGVPAFFPQRKPAVVEMWGPLAEPGSETTLAIATSLHLLVRPHIPEYPKRMLAPPSAYLDYKLYRPLEDNEVLYMEPALFSLAFGDALAITRIELAKAELGGVVNVLPESEAPLASLANRSAFIIGTPVNSLSTKILHKGVPWTIGFTEDHRFAIFDQRRPVGQQIIHDVYWNGKILKPKLYGLITVLNSSTPDGQNRRVISISGTGSPAVLAAAQFITSEEKVGQLKASLSADGLPGFPHTYQVLVEAETRDMRLLNFRYLAHTVVVK
jgi:hypothetical protein